MLDSSTLAIRIAHPQRGIHYYVRRAGTHDATVARTDCDASALRDQGTQDEAMGKHAAAIKVFEDAYACNPNDGHTAQLAFMASCNAGDLAKARHYYGILTPEQRDRVVVMCIRNHITREQLEAALGLPPPPADAGTLRVTSQPPAQIDIDGTDTNLTTPIMGDQLRLAPGRHRVTFRIGEDRYTYLVTIKTGSTETISKDLR